MSIKSSQALKARSRILFVSSTDILSFGIVLDPEIYGFDGSVAAQKAATQGSWRQRRCVANLGRRSISSTASAPCLAIRTSLRNRRLVPSPAPDATNFRPGSVGNDCRSHPIQYSGFIDGEKSVFGIAMVQTPARRVAGTMCSSIVWSCQGDGHSIGGRTHTRTGCSISIGALAHVFQGFIPNSRALYIEADTLRQMLCTGKSRTSKMRVVVAAANSVIQRIFVSLCQDNT